MKSSVSYTILAALFLGLLLIPVRDSLAKDVVRPEEIRSKREVVYDKETYEQLANLWKEYYDEFPSEYSYANWMYAARYAEAENYWKLLKKGLKKYPSNPKLLYLASMEKQGDINWEFARKYLEQAVAIDPHYTDPWFSLVTIYMGAEDEERTDLALRNVLESGIITDEIMDYNYNMLVSLEPNAILVTNGDNDTYPGFILTRLLNVRPDVIIANRSLLNTEWYPEYLLKHNAPPFLAPGEIKSFRESLFALAKEGKIAPTAGGLFGDSLIVRIVAAAQQTGRPVYFSHTLYETDVTKRLSANGRDLGLVTLVTPAKTPYEQQLRTVFSKWLNDFRTGGLDSWRLRQSKPGDAGRMLTINYAAAIAQNLDSIAVHAPNLRTGLFQWYVKHSEPVLMDRMKAPVGGEWCKQADLKEVQEWCKAQGFDQ